MIKRRLTKVDDSRLTYEYPLLLPLIAAFHVGGRTIHEAMYYLSRERVEPLKESSKLARIYMSIFARHWDVIRSLQKLAKYTRLAPLRSFLASYTTTLASRGGAIYVVERGLDAALEELRVKMNTSIELVNMLSEAVILFSAITVFVAGLFAANPAILLALYSIIGVFGALLLLTRPRVAEVYLGRPSPLAYAVSIVANLLVFLAIIGDVTAGLSMQEHICLAVIAVLLAPAPVIELKRVLDRLRLMVMLSNALTETLQLGLDPMSTLEKLAMQSITRKKKAANKLLRLKESTPVEEYLGKITLILSQNGVRAARSARLLTTALEGVELGVRWLIKRSIIYDSVALVSLAILVMTADMLSVVPSMVGGLQLGMPNAPIPLQALEAPPFLKPGLAAAIIAAVYFAGAALRGSIAYSITPSIVFSVYIATQLVADLVLGIA